MTDRLTALLHAEADEIHAPPAPATDLLVANGRRIRVRRRVRAGVVAAAVLAVIGAGIAVSITAWQGPDRITPAEQVYLSEGAWIDGEDIHVGDHTVRVPNPHRVVYTSVGAVVVPFDDAHAGAGSPLTLVRPDGTTTEIVTPGLEALPGTDPSSSNLAYVHPVGEGYEHWELVVLDVATGKTVATIPYDDEVTTGSGNAPDLDLHGDTVLVEIGDELTLVDWRSGDRDPVATKGSGVAFHGSYGAGRYIVGDTGFGEPVEHWQVRSWTDGALVGEFPGGATAELSPDGRYLKVGGNSAFTVYDVATGDPVSEGEGASRYGWSPDGHVVGPAGNPQVLFVRGAQNQDQSEG